MVIETINGKEYRLPNSLSAFRKEMFVHLINKKWSMGIMEPGKHTRNGLTILYDAILPELKATDPHPLVYGPITDALAEHERKFPFRLHEFFNHMVSSQAANINLFLPILNSERAEAVLRSVKPDIADIARNELDNGYQIEYYDKELNSLGDKNPKTGTDSDMAIAYYNYESELCLWLIEHKLTEPGFTTCGGYASYRNKKKHQCESSFDQLLANKNLCYYHHQCGYQYWNLTEENKDFFKNASELKTCPFKGGMNQLWRNQLMGLAIESSELPYEHVYFSVVNHPDNQALNKSLQAYKQLINHNEKFSVFTSDRLVAEAKKQEMSDLDKWVKWYSDMYLIND